MKIGDKVRFLNEKGGGRVAGFQGKNLVLVEDEDGFQVPMMLSEVVVVGDESYDTTRIVEGKQKAAAAEKKAQQQADPIVEPQEKPEERKGGEQLSAYLAFVPKDVKELTKTHFDVYIINDSNYYMRFTILSAEGNAWRLRFTDELEPNTKLFLQELAREDLPSLDRVAVQLLPYKREKTFQIKSPVNVQMRIDSVKFYKLHTFQENDFFCQPAFVCTIVENDEVPRPLVIDAQKLKASLYASEEPKKRPIVTTPKKEGDPLAVDLHADELLETTAGMSGSDILNYQLDVFRRTLKQHEKEKGMKIVFIHGKGDGVLRKALINELHYRYKNYTFQDASFQEYGFGATQVTIK